MPFEAEKWVLVCDFENDKHSQPQVEKLQELGYDIKGAIQCHDSKYADSEACMKVPAFPTFCNSETNLCVAGLRTTPEHFEDLQRMSDAKK